MFCQNCGTELPNDVKFCKKCGEAVGKVTPEVVQQVAIQQESSKIERPYIGWIIVGLIGIILFVFLANKKPGLDLDIIQDEIMEKDFVYLNTDLEIQSIEIDKKEMQDDNLVAYITTEATGNNMKYIGSYEIICALDNYEWHIDEMSYCFEDMRFIPDANNFDYTGTWVCPDGLAIIFQETDFEKGVVTVFVDGYTRNVELEGFVNETGFGMQSTDEERLRFEYSGNGRFGKEDYFSMYYGDEVYVKISDTQNQIPGLVYSTSHEDSNLSAFRRNLFQIRTTNSEVVLDGTNLMSVGGGYSDEGGSVQIDFQYHLEEHLSRYTNQLLEVVYAGEVIETMEYTNEDIQPFLTIMLGTSSTELSKSEISFIYNALMTMINATY